MKALVLFSGGLDSSLVYFWAKETGIETENIFIKTPFNTINRIDYFAKIYKINYSVINTGDDYLQMIENPSYGRGKNLNPCIDCHAYMLKKVGNLLKEKKAYFIITGDVLGQRPMSQRKDGLKAIDKLSGYGELTLRPLSGKLLEKTTPEKLGWIKRENMFSISGRTRKVQLELAKHYGISDFENPGGGCLLTDVNISKKIFKLIENKNLDDYNIKLIRIGRHFKSRTGAKIIVGKNEMDNQMLEKLKREGDIVLRQQKVKAPSAMILSPFEGEDFQTATDLIGYFAKASENEIEIETTNGIYKNNILNTNQIYQMKYF